MMFKMKEDLGFDTRVFYTDRVIARKLNGYIVDHMDQEVFVAEDDIVILEISDEEKNAPVRW